MDEVVGEHGERVLVKNLGKQNEFLFNKYNAGADRMLVTVNFTSK